MKKSIMYQISYIIEVADTEIPNQDKREAFRKKVWSALPDEDIEIDDSHVA